MISVTMENLALVFLVVVATGVEVLSPPHVPLASAESAHCLLAASILDVFVIAQPGLLWRICMTTLTVFTCAWFWSFILGSAVAPISYAYTELQKEVDLKRQMEVIAQMLAGLSCCIAGAWMYADLLPTNLAR